MIVGDFNNHFSVIDRKHTQKLIENIDLNTSNQLDQQTSIEY